AFWLRLRRFACLCVPSRESESSRSLLPSVRTSVSFGLRDFVQKIPKIACGPSREQAFVQLCACPFARGKVKIILKLPAKMTHLESLKSKTGGRWVKVFSWSH